VTALEARFVHNHVSHFDVHGFSCSNETAHHAIVIYTLDMPRMGKSFGSSGLCGGTSLPYKRLRPSADYADYIERQSSYF